jgi:hypothetical protein
MALAVNRAVAGDGLNENQPILFGIVQNHIRHFAVGIDIHAELGGVVATSNRKPPLRILA